MGILAPFFWPRRASFDWGLVVPVSSAMYIQGAQNIFLVIESLFEQLDCITMFSQVPLDTVTSGFAPSEIKVIIVAQFHTCNA